LDVRDAVISFQYAERIKSGLIIASKLVDEVAAMDDEERKGARKLLIHFMNALLGEIRIAYNASQLNFFKEAGLILEEGIENIRSEKYEEALRSISYAISSATTGGEIAANILRKNEIL